VTNDVEPARSGRRGKHWSAARVCRDEAAGLARRGLIRPDGLSDLRRIGLAFVELAAIGGS